MIVSLKWLKRYFTDLNASVLEVEKALTDVGLEVEGTKNKAEIYSKLVVGEVLTCEKHPDAEKLSITKLFDGEKEIQVVCGAPNVAAGQKVVFAPVGTVLPMPEGKPLKLKKAKIRGVESFGMICGEDEVGLGTSHDGILVLDSSLKPGTFLSDLGMYDTIFEINVTPNRPDALNHIGVARELAAHFGVVLKLPATPSVEVSTEVVDELIKVEVEDKAGCSRYVARVIKGVKVEPSPAWMQELLESVGVRPINNVVDVTNFVLFEFGQPLHAFDLAKVKSKTLSIRKAKEGEKLTTLDEIERVMKADELLICDGQTPACVAGVMGGLDTEVDDSTTDVVLETAWFSPSVIRKQARRLSLGSDSSFRFERGIDPFVQEEMSVYAASLIVEICGGVLVEGNVSFESDSHQKEPVKVALRHPRIMRILGFSPSQNEVTDYLTGIGLKVVSQVDETTVFEIPGFRPDLTREVDLLEEVARLAGFDNVPTVFPSLELRANPLAKTEVMQRKVRKYFTAVGLNEGLSLRFIREKDVKSVFGDEDLRSTVVTLENAISEEWGVMPTSHIPKLLKNISFNSRNQEKSFGLFELTRGFYPALEKATDKHPGVKEKSLLSGALAGVWNTSGKIENPAIGDVLYLKSLLLGLFRQLQLEVHFKRPSNPVKYYHPLKQLDVFLGEKKIGELGEIHPKTAEEFSLGMVSCLFELDFDSIVKKAGKVKTFKAFSKFGEMKREISCLVASEFDNDSFIEKVKQFKVKNLVDVKLSSIYEGENVPKGKKSVNYQFIYQSESKTLTDSEVNKAQDKLAARLGEDSDIEYR